MWAAETLAEFAAGFALTRYGNLMYWSLDRFFLEPVLIRPTEWVLEKLTVGYGRLLRWSLRYWWIVLAQVWYYAQFKEQFRSIFRIALHRLWH